MDFSGILENIKSKFSQLKEKIQNYVENNKKMAIVILAAVVLILVLLLIILISAQKSKNKNTTDNTPKLILTEELQAPDGPELPEDYNISRITKDKWSQEDGKDWFTVPSSKEINSLSDTNENMVNEIIKAAP